MSSLVSLVSLVGSIESKYDQLETLLIQRLARLDKKLSSAIELLTSVRNEQDEIDPSSEPFSEESEVDALARFQSIQNKEIQEIRLKKADELLPEPSEKDALVRFKKIQEDEKDQFNKIIANMTQIEHRSSMEEHNQSIDQQALLQSIDMLLKIQGQGGISKYILPGTYKKPEKVDMLYTNEEKTPTEYTNTNKTSVSTANETMGYHSVLQTDTGAVQWAENVHDPAIQIGINGWTNPLKYSYESTRS